MFRGANTKGDETQCGGLDAPQGPCHTYYRRLQHQQPWSLPEMLPPSLPHALSDLQGSSQSPHHLDFPEFRLRIHLADKMLKEGQAIMGPFPFL